MATAEIDAFLGNKAAPDPAPPPAEAPPAAPPAEAAPTTPEPAKAAPAPATPPDEDAEPPEPEAGEAVVPRRALEDERHKRQDWKAKAIEAETKRAELERQLNEAKAARPAPAPAAAAPPPPEEIPNPNVDPQAYHAYLEAKRLHDNINHHFNTSERLLRREKGDAAVDAALAEFQKAVARDPSLGQQLRAQLDPWGWAFAQVERFKLLAEVGDDPAAYRAKIEADARAKWEAERATPPVKPVSPAANMAPSLANARSVAGRSAPAWTGPTPLDALVRH